MHNQRLSVETIATDEVLLETSSHEPFTQRVDSAFVRIGQAGVQLFPVRLRYAYVSELDLMAQLAGLHLRDRWADWQCSPYPSSSWMHVSVWEPAS